MLVKNGGWGVVEAMWKRGVFYCISGGSPLTRGRLETPELLPRFGGGDCRACKSGRMWKTVRKGGLTAKCQTPLLCLEVDVVVEATAPLAPCSLPRFPCEPQHPR